jgi:hypothetical protein
MSEAWKYGVRNKQLVTFCMIFEEQLRVDELSPEQCIIELVTQLEESFPPESWHVVLKQLQFLLSARLYPF